MRPTTLAKQMYCCELHFDIENDCIDYNDFKAPREGFRRYMKLKKDVLPHKNLPSSVEAESLELNNSNKLFVTPLVQRSSESFPDQPIADPLGETDLSTFTDRVPHSEEEVLSKSTLGLSTHDDASNIDARTKTVDQILSTSDSEEKVLIIHTLGLSSNDAIPGCSYEYDNITSNIGESSLNHALPIIH
ncbi:uncharacterized protein LOC131683145 isoform X2 [Topomyia yanbarensis]|nr:uncharacterized protein LOC131683145 isoform X2 [Topomyia yanbarensis]